MAFGIIIRFASILIGHHSVLMSMGKAMIDEMCSKVVHHVVFQGWKLVCCEMKL
jgi:hypothetical protein